MKHRLFLMTFLIPTSFLHSIDLLPMVWPLEVVRPLAVQSFNQIYPLAKAYNPVNATGIKGAGSLFSFGCVQSMQMLTRLDEKDLVDLKGVTPFQQCARAFFLSDGYAPVGMHLLSYLFFNKICGYKGFQFTSVQQYQLQPLFMHIFRRFFGRFEMPNIAQLNFDNKDEQDVQLDGSNALDIIGENIQYALISAWLVARASSDFLRLADCATIGSIITNNSFDQAVINFTLPCAVFCLELLLSRKNKEWGNHNQYLKNIKHGLRSILPAFSDTSAFFIGICYVYSFFTKKPLFDIIEHRKKIIFGLFVPVFIIRMRVDREKEECNKHHFE